MESLAARGLAREDELPGLGRVCRLHSRTLYRALGAEHIRHRKSAAPAEIARRLLGLDFVIGDLDRPWLPTEPEKVAAFEGAGIPSRILPKRVYGSPRGGRTVRPFGWKMPVAFHGESALFVFVDAGGETHGELLSWGAEHAPLWSALESRGVLVEVAAVSACAERLAGSERILRGWLDGGVRTGGVEPLGDGEAAELAEIERAVGVYDPAALGRWGGLDGAIARGSQLQRRRSAAAAGGGDARVIPGSVGTWLSGLERLRGWS